MLVVGDAHTLKVHVHTDDPEEATRLFDGTAAVSRLDVADMHAADGAARRPARQRRRRARRPAACSRSSPATGWPSCSSSLGATPLDGGQTLNPSTYDLLAGIHGVPAEEVVVLPNSPNVIMAAERAAELSDKTVRVVRARSQQAGLAAAVALDPDRRRGRQRRRDGGGARATCAPARVTEAARDDTGERFRRGEAVGFVDEELVAWGEPAATLEAVLGAARDATPSW